MIITILVKIVGYNTNQSQVHLKGGCRNSKKINAVDWQETTMTYDEWRKLPRACVLCSQLARPNQKEEDHSKVR